MSEFQFVQIPVTPFRQNCTLLWETGSKRAAIIDPGGEPVRILDAASRLALIPEIILLTHGHLDHAGGAAALKYVLDTNPGPDGGTQIIPIVGPDRRDLPLLERIETQAQVYGITGMRNVTPDRWLTEGDTVSVGGLSFEVMHCPGHTPGHVVFVSRALRFAVVGDVLFQNSIGRTDFPYGDQAALLDAIVNKLLPIGDDVAFICGHGPGSTFGAERVNNPFLRAALARSHAAA